MTARLDSRSLLIALAVAAAPAASTAQVASAPDGRITVVVLPFTMQASTPLRRHAHAPPRPAPWPVRHVAPSRVGEADAGSGAEPVMPVMPTGGAASETGAGAIAAELLVEHLLASGRFRVLDARQLEALQLERARADSGRRGARSRGARRPAAGEIFLLQGSVTRLGSDESTVGAGAGGGGLLGAIGIRRRETQVGLAARLVDAATGEVIASESAVGKSRKGKGLLLGGLGAGGGGGVMAGGGGETTALGQAMGRAVRELGREITEAVERRSGASGAGGGAGAGAKEGAGS